jgi:hypothetical protein
MGLRITAALAFSAALGITAVANDRQLPQSVPNRPRETASSSREVGLPGFRYRGADGCGRVFLYSWNDDRTEVLRIDLDMAAALGAPAPGKSAWQGVKTFDLEHAPTGVRVAVDLHPSAVYSLYCTSVLIGAERRVVWTAIAGKLTVDVGEAPDDARDGSFPVTAVLQGATFEAPDRRRIQPAFDLVVKTSAGRAIAR